MAQFHERFRTSVEELETASAAQAAAQFAAPFVGIRVRSDNITNAALTTRRPVRPANRSSTAS